MADWVLHWNPLLSTSCHMAGLHKCCSRLTYSPAHLFTRLEGAALPGPNGAAWWARWKDLRTKDSSRENQVENLPKGELCTNQRREYGRLLFVQVTRPSPDDPNWFGKLLFTFCNSGCELSELGELVFFLFHTTSLLRNLWKSRRVDVEMRTLQDKTGLKSNFCFRRKLDSTHCNTRLRIRITPHNSRSTHRSAEKYPRTRWSKLNFFGMRRNMVQPQAGPHEEVEVGCIKFVTFLHVYIRLFYS